MTATASTATPVETVVTAAQSLGQKVTKSGAGWTSNCPGPRHSNGDRRPSLKIDEGNDGRALLYCHAGCDTAHIVEALGLTDADLFPRDSRTDVVQLRPRQQPRTVRQSPTVGPSRTLPPEPSPAPTVVPATSCDLGKCASIRKGTDLGQCVAQYTYTDAGGHVVGQVHRYDPKTFRPFTRPAGGQWKAGGKIPTPYRLPEVLAVLAAGGLAVIVEGEKDADALAALGLDGVAATCNAGGAGKWTEVHSQSLAGGIGSGSVCIVGDVDAAGQDHVRKVRESLAAVGIDAAVQWPTRGKDLAEHLANGGTLADLADDPEGSEPVEVSSWEPLDLEAYLDGSHTPEVAGLFPRTDGACLLYAGRLHSFHGESESGKSLVAQAEAARLLAAGGRVLFIDFESDAATVVPRLIELGADAAGIRAGLRYVRPQEPPTDTAGTSALDGLLAQPYDLAVIDGLTDALGMFGSSSLDLDEVSRFMRTFPRRVARLTGAATVVIDHVTKASDTRGRFAVGSQAKMNALDGAAYVIEVEQPLGHTLRGVVSMRVAKDRPGTVRPTCGPYRKTDRTQHAASIVFDATGDDGLTVVTVEPPTSRVNQDSEQSGPFRPTALMERVSDWLNGRPEPATTNEIATSVGGSRKHLLLAVDLLADEGHITRQSGKNRANLHTLARPYRQVNDPASDRYAGTLDLE